MGMRVGTFIRYGGVVSSILGGGQDNYETDHEWTPCTAPQRNWEWLVGPQWAPEPTVLYENSTKTLRMGWGFKFCFLVALCRGAV